MVRQNVVVDFQMQPANAATTVDVKAEIREIDVNSSKVGGNVDPGRMTNTPLNGRNWMELSLPVPGVRINAVSTVPLGSGSQGRFQINVEGQQVKQNAAGTGFGQPQYSREAMSQSQIITNSHSFANRHTTGVFRGLFSSRSKDGPRCAELFYQPQTVLPEAMSGKHF